MKAEPTVERLKELFSYDDGRLIRKIAVRGNLAGSNAGSIQKRGYFATTVDYKKVYNHRIIFCLFNGYMPKCVDHIDGNKENNKIENLREASETQNKWNSRRPTTNTSGIKGVGLHKASGKWRAHCRVNGLIKHLGLFDSKEDARIAVEKYRTQHHEEFARHG